MCTLPHYTCNYIDTKPPMLTTINVNQKKKRIQFEDLNLNRGTFESKNWKKIRHQRVYM